MASLAEERASQLSSALERFASVPLHVSVAGEENSVTRSRRSSWKGTLRKLGKRPAARAPSSPDALNTALYALVDSSREQRDEQDLSLLWLQSSQLAVDCYRTVLQTLFEDALRLSDAIEYWQSIETGSFLPASRYLVQTAPPRASRVLSTLSRRLADLAGAVDQPTQLWARVKVALPPSLLVTSIFPHLAQQQQHQRVQESRSLVFLAFSPLLLTRHEARLKRQELEGVLQRVERRIGILAGFAPQSLPPSISARPEALGESMGELVTAIYSSLSSKPAAPQAGTLAPCRPSELQAILGQAIADLKLHRERIGEVFANNAPPSRLLRSWPVVFFGPPVLYFVASRLWNARATFKQWALTAKETARGFLLDWVVEPIAKILETMRHGDSSLAIMGKESLKSDLDSLERMVADFTRDQKNYSAAQVQEIAARVREGDMTPVLRAWETDIKTPVRSAVTGSLLRTLLIQVQKVKVDVALAMDGIERMLRSQQLTFAFVGVAPSLLVVFALERAFLSLVPSSAGRKSGSKAARRRAWATVRRIDRLVTPAANFSPDSEAGQASLGRLLVETSVLRAYAAGRDAGPLGNPTLREAFLEDIRDLEQADTEGKRRALDRLWRSWQSVLWDRIL